MTINEMKNLYMAYLPSFLPVWDLVLIAVNSFAKSLENKQAAFICKKGVSNFGN
jgi:hypothetical protein